MLPYRLGMVLALTLAACNGEDAEDSGSNSNTGCSEEDADNDGLDGCTEEELGTDPDQADSDGDGFDDGEEIDCVSDPLDGDEACYACGWEHNDPGDLVSTGAAEGDVIANLELIDQCEEEIQLWDFAGEYHILFITASW